MRRMATAGLACCLLVGVLAFRPADAAPALPAQSPGDTVGCGTDHPSYTVNLVGTKGAFWFNWAVYNPNSVPPRPWPSNREYDLPVTVAPGEYQLYSVSMDDHLGDLFRVLFGVVDDDDIEQFGLAFDYGGANEIISPNLIPDLPDNDNWMTDVPLADPVPFSWSWGYNHPLFPQKDPVTPGNVLGHYPGYDMGVVDLTDPQDSVWAVHAGELSPGLSPDLSSIIPWTVTFECVDDDDCDDEYSNPNTVLIDDPTPAAGQTVTLTSEGFEPGVTVDITLVDGPGPDVNLGTSVIGPETELDVDVTIPPGTAPGNWTIKVRSQKCSLDVGTVVITVG